MIWAVIFTVMSFGTALGIAVMTVVTGDSQAWQMATLFVATITGFICGVSVTLAVIDRQRDTVEK